MYHVAGSDRMHPTIACMCVSTWVHSYGSTLQRLRLDDFESNMNQEDVNKAAFLESDLNFLAPVSLEDPVEPMVAKAVRSMVHHCMLESHIYMLWSVRVVTCVDAGWPCSGPGKDAYGDG